jgi:hypothetical protein
MDPELVIFDPPPPLMTERYPTFVDYGLDFEEAVKMGGYNYVHPEFLPPVSWLTNCTRKENLDVYLEAAEHPLTTEEAMEYLRFRNRRPLTVIELLAFGAQYNEVQWRCPIIALGSRWKKQNGDQGVAYLWYNPFGRALLLSRIHQDQRWQPFCRFAAVPIW